MFEKIALISDSHGSTLVMRSILTDPPEGLSAVFHLGDGERDAWEIFRNTPAVAYLGVRGNCDLFSNTPVIRVTERCGVRFMLTHGHAFGVKSAIGPAAAAAEKEGASVLLYGHTHIHDDRLIETPCGYVRVINPGSAAAGEYVILTLTDSGVECEHKLYRTPTSNSKK